MMLHGQSVASGNDKGGERVVYVVTEIRIAVLRPHLPIVGDGILDAAADGPARTCLRNALVEEEWHGDRKRMVFWMPVKAAPPVA